MEGDEGYTRLGERTFPPQIQQNGPFIKRKSRYWIEARAGVKDVELFARDYKEQSRYNA